MSSLGKRLERLFWFTVLFGPAAALAAWFIVTIYGYGKR
jgi:hypothetical protein